MRDRIVLKWNWYQRIVDAGMTVPCRGTMHCAPTQMPRALPQKPSFQHIVPQSLGAIIRGFKAAVTKRIRSLPDGFDGDVWQRNYHERVIRNDAEHKQMRTYIRENPKNWERDEENIQ